jgi:hypothetical protein
MMLSINIAFNRRRNRLAVAAREEIVASEVQPLGEDQHGFCKKQQGFCRSVSSDYRFNGDNLLAVDYDLVRTTTPTEGKNHHRGE